MFFIFSRHIHDSVNRQWDNFDRNKDQHIAWDEYKVYNYGSDEGNVIIAVSSY